MLDFADTHPNAGVDIAGREYRNGKVELIVGGITGRFACIEVASAGAPDIAAGAELTCQRGGHNSGPDRAILQRGGVVVKLNEAGKAPVDFVQNLPDGGCAGSIKIGRHASGNNAIHHQPMTERGVGSAQHAFAQDAAMSMHEGERGIIADRADIAEMVGEALQLGHQCPQIAGAWRWLNLERRFDRMRESDTVGGRAVAQRCGAASCAARSMVAPAIRDSIPL